MYTLRGLPGAFTGLYPIGIHLVGIGLFFVVWGIDGIARPSCAVVDCAAFTGGIAVTLAASFMARFPLRELLPARERLVFLGLVAVSIGPRVALTVGMPGL